MNAPRAPLDPRLTEQRNPATAEIDLADPARIVELMNQQDRQVPEAVWAVRDAVARGIEMVERAFRAGGRLIYAGAGTSGRLGVLDAAECPPTFGTPPEMVQAIIAGGVTALLKSAEGTEDDFDAGGAAVDAKEVRAGDVVFGIAASGTTPFVRGALARAAARGAATILLSCTDPPKDLLVNVDLAILPKVGPEAVTGSTRLKAGTATKLVLNTVTTGAMIRMGRAYGNLMVDLVALSDKLKDRGERIVMEVCAVDREAARRALAAAAGHVKTAIVMLKRRVDRAEAERLLREAGGYARRAVGEPPPPPAAAGS
ncbi:MAG: N-acetylmuramic acid 6-phosphate etherase [Gemmatimonadales bacterium]|jgi:N-acetylmuramic acid 6-phosphate etherase